MQILFNSESNSQWRERLVELAGHPARTPFDEKAQTFVQDFARALREHPGSRQFPELAALAYWFRPSAIRQLEEQSSRARSAGKVCSRGLVFHLAPANVDILFAYGWLLSVLAGNTNIARLSQRATPQRAIILEIVRHLSTEEQHRDILVRTLLITYPHDAEITGEISKACDARLIWGGDATVSAIRALPIRATAIELAFADRYSLAAFSSTAIVNLDGDSLSELARKFCNDILWFQQQACSSPRSLFWIGTEQQTKEARIRFLPALLSAASLFGDEPSLLMTRVTDLFMLAASGLAGAMDRPISQFPLCANGTEFSVSERAIHSGNGLLVEHHLGSLQELGQLLLPQDQTLVAFGFSACELDKLIHYTRGRALDRVVAPGEALNFDSVWDGIDLMSVLTRQIRISSPIQER